MLGGRRRDKLRLSLGVGGSPGRGVPGVFSLVGPPMGDKIAWRGLVTAAERDYRDFGTFKKNGPPAFFRRRCGRQTNSVRRSGAVS